MKEIEVECSRVSGILSELIMGLDLAIKIPEDRHHAQPVITSFYEHGRETVGLELESLVTSEAEFREAIRSRSSGYIPSEVGGGGALLADDSGTRFGMRAVATAFRSDPEALKLLPQPQTPNHRMVDFMMHIHSLSEVLVRRLQTSKARQNDDALELANRQRRIDEGEKEITRVTELLRKQRLRQRAELAEVVEKEAVLHKELAGSTASSQEALQGVLTAGATRAAASREDFAGTITAVTAELEKAQVEYKVLCDAHAEAEAALRKNVVRRRLESETAMREFDVSVGALQAKLTEALNTKTEQAALEDYLQYFLRVDAEKAVIEAERVQAERDFLIGVTLRNAVRDLKIKCFILPFVLRQKKRIAELVEALNLRQGARVCNQHLRKKKKPAF